MALSIKNKEVEVLARELARRTGVPITVAVRDALRKSVDRARLVAKSQDKSDEVFLKIMEIGRRAAARPVINNMTDDEILGYDEFGVPTK